MKTLKGKTNMVDMKVNKDLKRGPRLKTKEKIRSVEIAGSKDSQLVKMSPEQTVVVPAEILNQEVHKKIDVKTVEVLKVLIGLTMKIPTWKMNIHSVTKNGTEVFKPKWNPFFLECFN
jgi:hypothetical protein